MNLDFICQEKCTKKKKANIKLLLREKMHLLANFHRHYLNPHGQSPALIHPSMQQYTLTEHKLLCFLKTQQQPKV